jgi:hypothetical protein
MSGGDFAHATLVEHYREVVFMNDKHSGVTSLPPRLPQNEEELKRTIILLGNRKQAELKSEARRQLESLIGIYPTIKEASRWKRVLRQACKGLSEL